MDKPFYRSNMKTQTVLEKGSARTNEDYLVIQDNIFAVFDGATSLTAHRYSQGRTGGELAARTAGSVFRKNHFPLTRLAGMANREIMAQMDRNGVDTQKKENLWSTSAAAVRIQKECLEWIQTGDAVIILIYDNGSHQVLAGRDDHDYETLSMWKRLVTNRRHPETAPAENRVPDQKVPAIRQALASQIKKVRRQMNVTYGVLNGEPEAERFINQGMETLGRVTDILMFTDGLTIPRTMPEKRKDFSPLVSAYQSFGLDGLRDMIRLKEREDPDCLAFPRFKCHDDMAAIAISL